MIRGHHPSFGFPNERSADNGNTFNRIESAWYPVGVRPEFCGKAFGFSPVINLAAKSMSDGPAPAGIGVKIVRSQLKPARCFSPQIKHDFTGIRSVTLADTPADYQLGDLFDGQMQVLIASLKVIDGAPKQNRLRLRLGAVDQRVFPTNTSTLALTLWHLFC
jgi:hypothetical protein